MDVDWRPNPNSILPKNRTGKFPISMLWHEGKQNWNCFFLWGGNMIFRNCFEFSGGIGWRHTDLWRRGGSRKDHSYPDNRHAMHSKVLYSTSVGTRAIYPTHVKHSVGVDSLHRRGATTTQTGAVWAEPLWRVTVAHESRRAVTFASRVSAAVPAPPLVMIRLSSSSPPLRPS